MSRFALKGVEHEKRWSIPPTFILWHEDRFAAGREIAMEVKAMRERHLAETKFLECSCDEELGPGEPPAQSTA
jgi:hypothetical protein